MEYMELVRESAVRKRATNMHKSLNSFIELEKPIESRQHHTISDEGSSILEETAHLGPVEPHMIKDHYSQENHFVEQPLKNDVQATSSTQRSLDLGRVAALLRASLEVEDGGGVVFFDTSGQRLAAEKSRTPSDLRPYTTQSTSTLDGEDLADVLAASTSQSTNYGESVHSTHEGFSKLPIKQLHRLVQTYPRGKLWVLNADGQLNAGIEPEFISQGHSLQPSCADAQSEATLVRKYFPGACQVLFVPCWNTQTARWCVCLAYSTSQYRTFTHETELLYCMAFCNCITIEMTRLATIAADRQKGGNSAARLRFGNNSLLNQEQISLVVSPTSYAPLCTEYLHLANSWERLQQLRSSVAS